MRILTTETDTPAVGFEMHPHLLTFSLGGVFLFGDDGASAAVGRRNGRRREIHSLGTLTPRAAAGSTSVGISVIEKRPQMTLVKP